MDEVEVNNLFKRPDLVFWRRLYGSLSLIMITLGLIGCSFIIVITYRNKELRTKSGYLLCSLAFVNFFCLLFEITHSILMLANSPVHRMDCIRFIYFYPLTFNLNSLFVFSLVLDIFLALKKSTWYYCFSKSHYISYLWTAAFTYGGTWMIVAHLTYPDNEFVPYCDPVTTLHPSVGRWQNGMYLFLHTITFAFFFLSMAVYKRIGKKHKETKGVMRRMQVMSFVFFASTYSGGLGINFIGNFVAEPELRVLLETSTGIFAITAFGSPFFVCIWRSLEYRRCSYQLFCTLVCREYVNTRHVHPATNEGFTVNVH